LVALKASISGINTPTHAATARLSVSNDARLIPKPLKMCAIAPRAVSIMMAHTSVPITAAATAASRAGESTFAARATRWASSVRDIFWQGVCLLDLCLCILALSREAGRVFLRASGMRMPAVPEVIRTAKPRRSKPLYARCI
jgi:hypothetical protein